MPFLVKNVISKCLYYFASDLEIPWHEYELEWERFSKDNPDYPILNLYYEDLHQVGHEYYSCVRKYR